MPMLDDDFDEKHKALYPDLAEHGGLGNALQAAFADLGSALLVAELEQGRRGVYDASVRSRTKLSQVSIGSEERVIVLDFWSRGVMLAMGKTPDLRRAAGAIDRWFASDCTTDNLARAFEFVRPEEYAWAYEQGVEIEHRWQEYLQSIPERIPELHAVVQAAASRPELRCLFPYTSHNVLCFSRCTGWPFTADLPFVVPLTRDPHEARYEVCLGEQSLGLGDAEQAIRLVTAHLPAHCGPAVAGTADDLKSGPD
jgi:hypothetical protein